MAFSRMEQHIQREQSRINNKTELSAYDDFIKNKSKQRFEL